MPSVEINMPTEGEKAPEGHDDKMTDLADKGTPEEAKENTPAAMPENGNEKFYNKETGEYNWENHAKDSDFRLNQSQNDKPVETPKPEENKVEGDKTATSDKGVDFQAYSDEFMANGELSDNSYKALEDAGFSRAMVDTQVAGLQAQMAAITNAAHDAAGSEENFTAMQEWARTNVPADQLKSYNATVNGTNDPNVIKLAVSGLYAKYADATGNDPNYVQGDGGGDGGADVYENSAEMMEDMKNPKYKTSPAFRKMVENKIGRSSIM